MAEQAQHTIELDDQTKYFQLAGVTPDELPMYKKKIICLGSELLDPGQTTFLKNCTHILAKDFKATEKILGALAAGKWILSYKYLEDSFIAGHWLHEARYEIDGIASYNRHRTARPYLNWPVYIALSNRMRAKSFAGIFEAGGAIIITRNEIVNKSKMPEYVFSDQGSSKSVRELVGGEVPILDTIFIKETLILKKDPKTWKLYQLREKINEPVPVYDLTGDSPNRRRERKIPNDSSSQSSSSKADSLRISNLMINSPNIVNSKRRTRMNNLPISPLKRSIEEVYLNSSGGSNDCIILSSPESTPKYRMTENNKTKITNLTEVNEIEIIQDIAQNVCNNKHINLQNNNSYGITQNVNSNNLGASIIKHDISSGKKDPSISENIDSNKADLTHSLKSGTEVPSSPSMILPKTSTKDNPAKLVVEADKKALKQMFSTFIRTTRRTSNFIFNNLNNYGRDSRQYRRIGNNISKSRCVKDTELLASNMFNNLHRTKEDGEEDLSFRDDETEVIYIDCINWLHISLLPTSYPPAETFGQFLKMFNGQCNWHNAELKASAMIKTLLQLHPPSNCQMRDYYYDVFCAAAPSGYHANKPWEYIQKIINDAAEECNSKNADWQTISSACRPLEYVLSILKDDLAYWNGSRETIPQLLSYKIIFKHSQNTMVLSIVTKDIIKLWIKSYNWHFILRNYVTQLFELMIEVIWTSNQKTDALSPSSYCPPQFLQKITHELHLQMRKLPSSQCHLKLARLVCLPRNKLYIACVIYQMNMPRANYITLKTVGDLLKHVVDCCGVKNNEKGTAQIDSQQKCRYSKEPNKRNYKGETALFRACRLNNLEKVEGLLSKPGIDVNIPDHNGITPLHQACIAGYKNIVNALLKYQPAKQANSLYSYTQLLTQGQINETPLHDAVENKHYSIVKMLLKCGGESLLSARTVDNKLPSDYATDEKMKKLMSGYKGKIGTLFLNSLKGLHKEFIEIVSFLLNAYLDVMGVRTLRQKLQQSSVLRIKSDIAASKIGFEEKPNKCIINQDKSKLRENMIPGEDAKCIKSCDNENVEFWQNVIIKKKDSFHTRSERYSREFENSMSYVIDDLISCRRILDYFGSYKRKCSHTKYLEVVLGC